MERSLTSLSSSVSRGVYESAGVVKRNYHEDKREDAAGGTQSGVSALQPRARAQVSCSWLWKRKAFYHGIKKLPYYRNTPLIESVHRACSMGKIHADNQSRVKQRVQQSSVPL